METPMEKRRRFSSFAKNVLPHPSMMDAFGPGQSVLCPTEPIVHFGEARVDVNPQAEVA
jgi:hypothetical protein